MRNYTVQSEAKIFFKIYKEKQVFALINTVKNIFLVSQKLSLCYNKIPCVFSVWKK